METDYYEFPGQSGTVKSEIYDWVESAVFAVVCMILVFVFLGRMISVDGESMLPTLNDQDRLISSRLMYTPRYGDIVIVTKPTQRSFLQSGRVEPLIKRVIATEGQTIDIDFIEGVVTLDGVELNEPYINDLTHYPFDMKFPQTVPEGCVFVMGDNRNHSWDSRDSDVGMVDQRYLLGRVIYRVSPFSERGNPDDYWRKSSSTSVEQET